MAKSFLRNHLTAYKIGEDKETATIVIGSGIKEVSMSVEEEMEEIPYYDLGGGKEAIYDGVTGTFVFTGDRDFGDIAQNKIREKLYKQDERKLYLIVTEPDGRVVEGFATVGDIVPGGGEALKRGAFEFTLKFIGTPLDTAAV